MAVDSLTIRHLINPNDTLANFVISNPNRINTLLKCINTPLGNNSSRTDCTPLRIRKQIIAALIAEPVGRWHDALISLASFEDDACKALQLRIQELTQNDRKSGQKKCDRLDR